MKVITDKKIIVQKGHNAEYSNAGGDKLKDKAKGLVGSGKVKGLLDLFGGSTGNTGGTYTPPAPTPAAKPKMKTGTKVLIGVGSALVIGAIIYFVTRKKK